eukprot:1197803-Amphidinium_carterae.1
MSRAPAGTILYFCCTFAQSFEPRHCLPSHFSTAPYHSHIGSRVRPRVISSRLGSRLLWEGRVPIKKLKRTAWTGQAANPRGPCHRLTAGRNLKLVTF